ncbi:MAG TPA: redoxin domain-containing protein, partial [Candidatus Bathyarchaeia archaeon]|nr:redoxin domain-containing protein [Candidatus Bathyarchaeia archaeon]
MRLRPLVVASFLLLAVFVAAQQPSASNPAFTQQYQSARAALDAGQYQDALDGYKRAAKLSQQPCAECFMGMAVADTHMARLNEALNACDKAIAAASTDQARAEAHILKGKALLSIDLGPAGNYNKQVQQAEQEFRTAVELQPKDPVARLNLAFALVRQMKDDGAKAELEQCLALHPPKSISDAANQLLANPRTGREPLAPEFQVTTLQGETLSLKQLSGKIVVLDFWATWCPPCRASVGELKELTKKYPDTVELISVSADEKEGQWRDFVASKKMTWPQYID